MNYNEAKLIFSKCRNKELGTPIKGKRATRLVQYGSGYGIQYHDTVVVVIKPDNSYELRTGGWYTNTTKARIRQYSPARLSTQKGKVYLLNEDYKKIAEFYEGITITAKGDLK